MTNKKISQDGKTIVRFSLGTRIGHGLHAIFFVLLFVSGCAIAFRGFGKLIGIDALRSVARLHETVAIVFLVPIIILILFSRKNFFRWIKETFSFGKNDWAFVKAFPKDFFCGKGSYPPQGRFNGGEKINSMVQIFGFITMITTGAIMKAEVASASTIGWATTIHSFCGLALGAIIMAHAYLGLFHKGSKPSITGMITGKIPMDYAKSHHPLWVKEVEAEDKDKEAK